MVICMLYGMESGVGVWGWGWWGHLECFCARCVVEVCHLGEQRGGLVVIVVVKKGKLQCAICQVNK